MGEVYLGKKKSKNKTTTLHIGTVGLATWPLTYENV